MTLSWSDISANAVEFVHEWKDEKYEKAEAQTFWNEFFEIFGIRRRRLASFEEHVKLLGDKSGFIDLFWKGMLIAEHKSLGKSLDSAYMQAIDYTTGLSDDELPR